MQMGGTYSNDDQDGADPDNAILTALIPIKLLGDGDHVDCVVQGQDREIVIFIRDIP